MAQPYKAAKPRLSLGLPVFNGERYIEQTLQSLVAQSFQDFEIIISDNASTDATREICSDYVAEDKRIRYCRNEVNLGAAPNFNRVFGMSRGTYFKWAAHDDLYEPDFLLKCVETLERDRTVILAFSEAVYIDESGRIIRRIRPSWRSDSIKVHERFRYLTCIDHSCLSIFGVIRAEILRKTPLIGSYVGSDRVLLAELSLHGRFYEIPEPLFLHREHPMRSTRAIPVLRQRASWFDARLVDSLTFPYLRMYGEYIRAIQRSGLASVDKIRCYFQLFRWWRWNWRGVVDDLNPFLS